MRIQLIQKKVPIGSQIILTLKNDEEVSGLLTEIGLDYITLEIANRQKIILADAILMFDVQYEGSEVGVSTPLNANTEKTDDASEQVEVSESSDVKTEPTEPIPKQVEVSESSDVKTEPTEPVPEQVEAPDSTDANTETTDSVPDQVEVSNPTDANTETTDAVNFEEQVSEQLDEIESQFKNEIKDAKIELEPPDFTFPADELKGWQNTGIAGKWLQIKNKYENAQRINELSTKFGRIQPLLTEVKSLVRRFPNSPSLKRVTAYFYAVSDDWQEAIQIYKKVAITSEDFNDWFNVAVSALNLNEEELACYSLERFFNGVSVIEKPNAWNIYVQLVEKFNNFPPFRELCKIDENDIAENEIEVLLDATIYLFKKKVTPELAIEIVQKRIKSEPAKSLLKKVSQNLGGQSTESYRQFLSDFMTERIKSEKESPTILTDQPKSVSTTKGTVYQDEQQKQNLQMLSSDPYASAKRADTIEKDLEKAERLYRDCIRRNIRYESAIKDLAMVLVRLGRSEEAVELLEENRQKVKDKQALDNVLISVYTAAAQYEKAIDLLNNALKQAQDQERRLQFRMQIANFYIKLEDYVSAEHQFDLIQKLRPQNVTVQRNRAFCLSKQKRYDEAEKILNRIQNISPNAKTAELLEAIARAKVTGEPIRIDDSIIEIGLSDELSEFAKFFLEQCEFAGVEPKRVNQGKYIGSAKDLRFDIERLEKAARSAGTRRPRERSHYYLSASRIYFDKEVSQDSICRYLCRSFASRGDAAVSENRNLDTAREWYYESLRVYGGIQDPNYDEQDAVNALSRFLFSYLGKEKIPMSPYRDDENAPILKQQLQFIGNTVEVVISNHPQKDKAFDAIGYLMRSRYAANRILPCLYNKPALRNAALEYLQKKDIDIRDSIKSIEDFFHLWEQLRDTNFNETRTILTDLRFLQSNFVLTTAWLEDNLQQVNNIRSKLFLQLDQQRISALQRILETALELCRQVTFEEQERLCFQLDAFCQTLRQEITEAPTKLSVEDIYPITEVIQEKVDSYRNELYETSKPQLTLRLPVESYAPNINRKIEVQLVVENETGRSPSKSLELVIEEDEVFYEVLEPTIKRDESLRGGEKSILKVPLRVTTDALRSQTFSLSLCAQYRTRTEEEVQTPVQNLSIRLYSEDEFEKIENPYAAYAEGGIVGDAEMFFGRDELIQNISKSIKESHFQSKSVVVFGQKRSGKSSVLYHLKKSLQEDKNLLILDLENIAAILGENSNVSLLTQIFKSILSELQDAIEDHISKGFTPLEIAIPSDMDFYSHPNPQQCFGDVFKSFRCQISKQEDWRDVRVVLLIDEFQYIYDLIVDGKISDSFMKSWKAFLQANYFHTVLVGQDVMPKFKACFPNEFGTTQDERVTYLKPDDARRLIDEPICIGGRQGDSRYREQAIERILDLTAGSPFYIQIICNRLVEYMNVKHAGLVTEADVDQVKNELIRDVNALGLDKFDNLINSGDTSPDAISDEDALKVLKVIADNSSEADFCHYDKIACQTNSPIDTILDDLEKRDVVKRRDQSYQIQVGLFREWLIENG